MIYTITANPSVDYFVDVPSLNIGSINRASNAHFFPGGKGINVSIILDRLGEKSTCLGFLGGFTGEYITTTLANFKNITCSFTNVPCQTTRLNVKLSGENETEINGQGIEVPDETKEEFLSKLEAIKSDDFVIISGSCPTSLGEDFYKKIANVLAKNSVAFAIDSSGVNYKNSLNSKPHLIKPNLFELSELFGFDICTKEEIDKAANALLDTGIGMVLVSAGSKGAMLYTKNSNYICPAPKITASSTVGAGDTLLAAFIYATQKHLPLEKCLEFAVLCGSKTAKTVGLASQNTLEGIKKIYEI